jgi:hypothetical protein
MKALVFKEDYKHYKKDEILRIGSARNIDNWTHHMKDKLCIICVPEELEDEDQSSLEVVLVPEVPIVLGISEHWTNGTDTVYDVNSIPTLADEDGNPYLDSSYVHVDAVEGVPFSAAYKTIQKKTEA